MDWLEQTLLFLISLVANVFSAFAGGGAGLLQFPALIFLGLPFGVALATHKVASVALGVGATARHWREKSLEWRFAMFILAAGLPGVLLGAVYILDVPDQIARIALGVLTRAAPQLNLFAVGFPITLIGGFVMLILMLSYLSTPLLQLFEYGLQAMLGHLVRGGISP